MAECPGTLSTTLMNAGSPRMAMSEQSPFTHTDQKLEMVDRIEYDSFSLLYFRETFRTTSIRSWVSVPMTSYGGALIHGLWDFLSQLQCRGFAFTIRYALLPSYPNELPWISARAEVQYRFRCLSEADGIRWLVIAGTDVLRASSDGASMVLRRLIDGRTAWCFFLPRSMNSAQFLELRFIASGVFF
ncbi:hypothetical protein VNO77_02658 [Canavalia gladiata]|uniref:Uncharacterized protein n=1 Tax=Canavalia gladiata TaxID=3824 RepID=A0AAN9R382_CANGL